MRHTQMMRRLNVRNTKSDVNLAEEVLDEAEDDARTLCCEWDEHGERFKPFRKSVLESKTYDWSHGRIEGSPTCLHTCKAMEKLGGSASPRQWLQRFLKDKHNSSKDRAAHELRCLFDVLEEAACFDQVNSGALACLEVAARRPNLIVDAHNQGGAPSYVKTKYLTPLAETDEIFAPGLRAHLSRRAREDWEVMQSAKKADAASAMTDLMTYDDDGGNDGKQVGGIGKGQGKKSRNFRKVGAPPAEK